MQAWNDIQNDTPNIAIAISYNGNWHPEWIEKTYSHLRYFPVNWCTKINFLCKVPSISVSRDILVNQALEANCDYIFFMDTDHVFEMPTDPNVALNQLYQCINKNKIDKDGNVNKDAKIVSGLYRAKQKVGFNNAMWMKVERKGYAPIREWTGNWLEVDVVGLGCCLIDMQVFKDIERPWFKWEMKDDISEDFYFFELAKKHGYNTHIFTDVKLSHLGMLKVKSDGNIVIPDL